MSAPTVKTNPSLKTLPISQIMKFDPLTIKKNFKGKVNVAFSDGKTIPMNDAEIVTNRYLWELEKEFLNSNVSSDACIVNYYRHGYYHEGVLGTILSKQTKRIINQMRKETGISKRQIRKVARAVIKIVNKLHNELSYGATEHVKFIDLKDLLNVQLNPKVINSILAVKKNTCEDTIKASYDAIDNYMLENKDDTLPMLHLGKVIKQAQVHTMFGPRGGISNVLGVPYNDIVTNSLLMGLNKTSWYFQEAGTAAKAAMKALKAIQDSEVTSRLIQLIASFLSTIEFTDCGSTDYDEVFINPATDFRDSDLAGLVGKFYLDTDGELKEVKETDTHLIGTTILKRHIGGCKLHNQHKVCLSCFGSIGINIGPHVNIGHLAITIITRFITQNHLSQKHHIGSTFGNLVIQLTPNTARWFTAVENAMRMKIPEKGRTTIRIEAESCSILLNSAELIKRVDEHRMSVVTDTVVIHEDEFGGVTKDMVLIENEGRHAYMTTEFMLYARTNHILQGSKYLVIDVTDWKGGDMFRIINKEFDFATVNKEMDNAIMNAKSKNAGNMFEDYSQFVAKLTNIINAKMLVNAAWIETIAYAFTKDVYSGDTMRNAEKYTIESAVNVLTWRSFAPTSAHEGFSQKIQNPRLFTMKPVDHGNDIVFRPDTMMEMMPTQKDLVGFND